MRSIICRWCKTNQGISRDALRKAGLISSWNTTRIFYPLAFRPKGIVFACVCPSVRPSVCLFVCKLYLVRTITRHRFELESPNLHQTCILGYSRLVLKMEVFKVILVILTQNSRKFGLSARLLFTDVGQNRQICTKHASWDSLGWNWKWRSLTLTFKVILAILT